MSKNYLQSYEQAVLAVKQQIEPRTWEQGWLAGQQMKLEETIDFALAKFEPQNVIQTSKSIVKLSMVNNDPGITQVQTASHLPSLLNNLLSDLTGREKEVLKLIATGLTTKQMAAKLNLSPLMATLSIQMDKVAITTHVLGTLVIRISP